MITIFTDISQSTNYHPISVIPVIAKILEKIVSIQMTNYLETNHLLYPHQGAYRPGKSIEDVFQLVVDHTVGCLDSKVVYPAFLNLLKAFDSLHHCLLLYQPQDLAVSSNVLPWFQNYITGR